MNNSHEKWRRYNCTICGNTAVIAENKSVPDSDSVLYKWVVICHNKLYEVTLLDSEIGKSIARYGEPVREYILERLPNHPKCLTKFKELSTKPININRKYRWM